MSLVLSPPRLPSLISFLPDRVGVFDQGFSPVFKQARPMEVLVREESRAMEHPIEDGNTIIDHRIVLPVSIEMTMILPVGFYYTVYEEIKQLYLIGAVLIVQTKSSVYRNMFIKTMPHKETTDMYDRISIAIRFEEVQFAPMPASSVVNPADEGDTDTVERGTQIEEELTENKIERSLLRNILSPQFGLN